MILITGHVSKLLHYTKCHCKKVQALGCYFFYMINELSSPSHFAAFVVNLLIYDYDPLYLNILHTTKTIKICKLDLCIKLKGCKNNDHMMMLSTFKKKKIVYVYITYNIYIVYITK